MDSNVQKPIITLCPQCGNESMELTIERSGSGYNSEFEQIEHWFEGTGKCECGFSGQYGDSSL